MHILLTDVLACPRCGPQFGLIVLADRMEERRVAQGSLGCANCRESFAINDGVADLRFPPGQEAGGEAAPPGGDDAALRIAALLGARDRPGVVLLVGVAAETAAGVARLLPGSQVAVAGVPEPGPAADAEGISRIRVGARLPFRDRSLAGVCLAGDPGPDLLDEVLRALDPQARVVLDPAPPEAASALASRGLRVLLEQDGVVVASPSAAG